MSSMDEHRSQHEAEKLAARSATALRALEDRARSTIAARREQATKLEVEIASQFEEIAAAIASSERAAESQSLADDAQLQSEVDRLAKELDQSRAAWLVEQSTLEADRDELAKQIASLQSELQSVRDEWAGQVAEAESRNSALDGERRAEIERLTKELTESQAAWQIERSSLETARDELADQVAQLQSERSAESQSSEHEGELRAEVARLTKALRESQADWAAEQLALEAGRDDLAKQIAKLQADERAAREDWAKQLAEFEQKLRERESVWNNQRTEWSVARATLELERDSLQQKFELALQDVQRFRGRVAELEQELARRPEATQADSAELVALRAERDALAERVEQLERQPATQIDANAEQQMSDLQRRFELAVEDVRELKTKNAQLESQLAAGGKPAGRSADSGGLDWESQKRRLLASLADEGDASDEPARPEERLRIENTIEMTDAVVAEKDREIEELKSQLAQGGAIAETAADEEHEEKIRELVDADEVIAEHRRRIADLERETESKLRAAELELSLSRAKIARERVELDELRADLETKRADMGPDGRGTPGTPRRRWLSKLGLSGDEE